MLLMEASQARRREVADVGRKQCTEEQLLHGGSGSAGPQPLPPTSPPTHISSMSLKGPRVKRLGLDVSVGTKAMKGTRWILAVEVA